MHYVKGDNSITGLAKIMILILVMTIGDHYDVQYEQVMEQKGMKYVMWFSLINSVDVKQIQCNGLEYLKA